jgi:predicted aspartyl protease
LTTRRGLLLRCGLLAAGLGGAWVLRQRMVWPEPRPVFASGGQGEWLAFTSARDRLPTVEATVNGVATRALIDSGAQYSAMDTGLAAEAEVEGAWSPPMVAYGAGGNAQTGRMARIDVALGAVTIAGLRAAVLELGPLASTEGLGTPLILGHDVLSGLIVEIDVPRRRLRVLPPGTRTASDATVVPTREGPRATMATVVMEGAELEVVVDTGASGVLTLGEAEAERVGLLDGRALTSGRSVVLGGVIDARVAVARELRLGERVLTNVPVAIYRQQSLPALPAGLLGLGAFADQVMRLDIGGAGLTTAPSAGLTVG